MQTPAVGKCVMDLPKGWYHTPPVAKCLKVVTTHYLHTPLVVKLQRPVAVCTGYSHKPVVDKVLRDVRKYTIPVMGESPLILYLLVINSECPICKLKLGNPYIFGIVY